MIDFNNIKYKRPDYISIKNNIERLIDKLLKNNNNYDKFLSIVKEIISIQNNIEEMYDLVDIRNMRNQSNKFYIEEINYWNEYKPKYDILFNPFYEIILKSKYIDNLNKLIPPNYFRIITYIVKGKNKDIATLLEKENELKTKYKNLNRNKLLFNEEYVSISTLISYFKDNSRSIRKKAHDALNDYYYSKKDEYDDILYEMIKVRNKISKELGYSNYKEYSLDKQSRFDYDYKDIKSFRDNIIKYIVPICDKLKDKQSIELGIDHIKYYDTVFFKDNSITIYNGNDLLNKFKDIFKDIDIDLYNLYCSMLDKSYIDLESNDDKVNFSITNYLVDSKVPVITGNFKDTYFDIKTLTHEMGHSYQKYLASIKDREYIVPSLLKYPPMEVAEMFSYAMELISLDHIKILFKDEKDLNKYKFMEIYSLINNLPYICMVDEFQEIIYSKEDLIKQDLRKVWKTLSKKYHLEISNTGHINLDEGGYFYRQSHIYLDPFYYIDYALSYFGAILLYSNNLDLYKEVGELASYYSFMDLINKYNFPNVFKEQEVKNIAVKLQEILFSE